VHDCDVFEDDIVIRVKFNIDDGAFVSNNIDFLLDIALAYDDAWLDDRFLAGIDALDEVDSSEWLYRIQCLL